MITAELLDRLVEATNEAKATIREAHEARRDLKLLLKEADEKVGRIHAEVHRAVDDLATDLVADRLSAAGFDKTGTALNVALDKWLTLLDEAADVLEALNAKALLS